MNQGQSKKKVVVFAVIGILMAFIIGGLSYSVINGNKNQDTSVQRELSSRVASSEMTASSKKEKKTDPNLVGSYVADTGTDATVKSIGKNEWQINYQTGPEAVFGNFKTNWKEDAEGLKAKGTMYKGQEKYEFDFMVKVVSEKGGDDAVLIEFSDGDPNHLMTFKNKKARDINVTGSDTSSTNKSRASNSGGLTGVNSYNDLLKDDAWRYRAALIARTYLADPLPVDEIEEVSYRKAGKGAVGNPEGELYKSNNVQNIAITFEAPVQGANVQSFGMTFAKETDDKYIVYLTRSGGFVPQTTNQVFSLRDAYAKYNDSTTDAIAQMIK